jgi:hypothetical protein
MGLSGRHLGVLHALGAGLLGALSGGLGKFMSTISCALPVKLVAYLPVLSCNAGAASCCECWQLAAVPERARWLHARRKRYFWLNAGMMTLYTMSLSSLSAVEVTGITTAVNILCTGMISRMFFSGVITTTWVAGTACLITGTVLLTAAAATTSREGGKCTKKE